MDNRTGIPVSEMDDRALQMHALGVAYREAERRCEEAEHRCAEAEQRAERLGLEARDLEAQLQEMTEAYQALMTKNAELTASVRKQQKELEELRKAPAREQAAEEEKQDKKEPQERGQDA